MKQSIIKSAFIFVIMSALSCTQAELQQDDKYGYLTIGLTDDEEIVQMKSDALSQDKTYRIEVYDAEGNLDYSTDDHTSVSAENPVKLLMGKYEVKAIHGEPGTAFNLPCYSGSNSVRVFSEKQASVDILCKMGKVRFSVHFPEEDSFAQMFPLYELEVKADGKALTFSSTVTQDTPVETDALFGSFLRDTAYFEVPSDKTLTYTLKLVNADGAQYSVTKDITDVAVAEHYHLDFKMGEKEQIDGALVLDIVLDGEYDNVTSHNIILNFDKTYMPSYTTNSEFEPVPADGSIPVWPLGNETVKKFTFNAPRGIRNLVISHLDADLLQEGLPQLVDFVDISAEDLQIMNEIGITATTLTSANKAVQAEIDITEFIKNMHITPDGETYLMSLTVIDDYDRYARCDFEFTIVSDIQAETGSYFRWSSWAVLKGRYFSKTPPAGMSFLYKKASDTEWTKADGALVKIDESTMTYSCRITGLVPDTDYEYMAVSDKDVADGKTAAVQTFRTYQSEEHVYNLSFDDWMKGDGKIHNDTEYDADAWYPTNDLSRICWDTANGGTAMLSCFPTGPEETIVAVPGDGKKAAKMVSQMTQGFIKKFAAGNIYTGKFYDVSISPAGAMLDWGNQFHSRPLALRGWYRYEPKAINQVGSGYESYSGQTDKCQIQIFLTDWTGMFRINAYTDFSKSRYVDFNASYILAHGEIITDNNTTDDPNNTNGYVQFTIPLTYRSLKDPSFIVISGAASRYGDYFTGGEGSTLYLDELELIYDPTQLSDEEFNKAVGGVMQ